MKVPQEYSENVIHASPPDWVADSPIDLNSQSPTDERVSGGIWNLLSDIQHNLEDRIRYGKTIHKLATQGGVQRGSRFQIYFSPHLDQLFLHSLVLYRNNERIDLLPGQDVQIFNREEELEQDMFGGYLTAVLLLKDTRVGDIIEFSHSIKKLDTMVTDRSGGVFVLKGGFAFKQAKWRLLYSPERPVFAASLNHDVQPAVSYTDSGLVECRWEVSDLRPLVVEAGAPSWYMPLGLVEYGEYASWNDVAQWLCRLFYTPSEMPLEFEETVKSIAEQAQTFEERVQLALRFVQNDIRYVSVSVGEHSYKPYDIATIFERRFGDCKDKASLLGALLRALGIDALPAVVHTVRKHQVGQSLPNPHVFNHVIVRVLHKDRTYWFDPTISGQRGSLDKIFCPEYGKALVVSPDSQSLDDVVPLGNRSSQLKIVESFKIHQDNSPDEFSVSRVYEGAQADFMRQRIANSSHEQIEDSFLQEYLKLYPQISVARPWSVQDDEMGNRLAVNFEYRINNLWQPIPRQPGMCDAFFYATGIYHVVNTPPVAARKSPYAIVHPNNIENQLIVRTTRPLRFARGHAVVECDNFKYKWQAEVVSNALQFNMQYISYKDHVLPGEMSKYLKAIQQVSQHVRQGLILNISASRHARMK